MYCASVGNTPAALVSSSTIDWPLYALSVYIGVSLSTAYLERLSIFSIARNASGIFTVEAGLK